MYDEETDTAAKANTSDLNEELGQVRTAKQQWDVNKGGGAYKGGGANKEGGAYKAFP